jgi:hypothetical protein
VKDGNWIALHKELKYFLPHGRQYTILEAMFSYTLDVDNKREGTISGYAKLWGWSRTKVRKFIEEIKTVEGHLTNRQSTGKRHQLLLKINNLQGQKDKRKTVEKQEKDSQVDTTINPKPKPNPKPKKEYTLYGEFQNVKLTDEDYKKLSDKYNGSCDNMIETMSQYIDSKKKDPYGGKTHYSAILKNDHWLDKNPKKDKGGIW